MLNISNELLFLLNIHPELGCKLAQGKTVPFPETGENNDCGLSENKYCILFPSHLSRQQQTRPKERICIM